MASSVKPALLGSTRFNMAIIGFLGTAIFYTLRNDLSVSIVCMVNTTSTEKVSKSAMCPGENKTTETDTTNTINGHLQWSKRVQGSILSSFYLGYIGSQIPSGYLAGRFGGKIVIASGALIGAILTLLSPSAANINASLFIAVRILIGITQGGLLPSFHTIWSRWSPPLETSLLTGINYAGAQIGNVVVMPISGLLCKYGFAGGWPSIYYILGCVALLWLLIWLYYASDTPSTHKRISKVERSYINESLQAIISSNEEKKPPVPWLTIIRSKAVWGVWCGHFSADWGAYMMMTSLPLFMDDVLGFDITATGFIVALPYIAYFFCINIAGIIADNLRNRSILSTVATRRLAMIIALGSQAIFLVASGYCKCGQQVLVIIFLTIGIGISGVSYSGFLVNYLDIAPLYAGEIIAVGNTLSCLAGILCPLVAGWLTPSGSQKEWQTVFWVTACVLLLGTLIFVILVEGEILPWAKIAPHQSKSKFNELLSKSDSTDKTNESTTNEKDSTLSENIKYPSS